MRPLPQHSEKTGPGAEHQDKERHDTRKSRRGAPSEDKARDQDKEQAQAEMVLVVKVFIVGPESFCQYCCDNPYKERDHQDIKGARKNGPRRESDIEARQGKVEADIKEKLVNKDHLPASLKEPSVFEKEKSTSAKETPVFVKEPSSSARESAVSTREGEAAPL